MMDDYSTARLRARRLGPHDYDWLRIIQSCDEAMQTMGGPRTEEQTRAYLDRATAQWADHCFGFSLLFDRTTATLAGIGGVRIMTLDGVREHELGYGFLPPFWGRGLATEFALEAISQAEQLLGPVDFVAVITPGNVRSERVLGKVGFVREPDRHVEGKELPFFRRRAGGRSPAG